MGSSRVIRAVLLLVTAGAAFASCAKGNQLGVGGGGVGGSVSGTGTGAGGNADAGPTGMIGSVCTDSCVEGTCTLIGGTVKYCTQPCPPECPGGTYCSIIAGNPLCVPDLGQDCAKCGAAADCKLPSDACLTAPLGDTFCARDCTVDGLCPNGYVCTGTAGYEGQDGGGTGGAGAGSDGGGGGNDGGTGGSGLPSTPAKWCVPDGGQSCPCNAGRAGVTHACDVANDAGTCPGMETCDGTSAQWMGCTALTPVPEICNGKDDNCNGQIDEGDPNALCVGQGPPPPNASWACANGMCQLGACNPGWTAYPPGPVTAGCPCQVDANEPNGSCAAAKNVGTVTSTGGSPLVIQGTLSSDTDVDYYTFTTTDVNEVTTNSYNVNISFTQPTANTEFVMDVTRGAPCVDAPTGSGTSITSYSWCVNATGATSGEAPCGPTAVHHCADHSSPYFVRVHRAAGVTGTCTPYQITVTGGGGACDLTQTCP